LWPAPAALNFTRLSDWFAALNLVKSNHPDRSVISVLQGEGRALAMRVDFYGIYRPIVGTKSIEVEDGLSVRQVLDAVVARYPALRDELLDADGRLYPWVPVYVNGRNPRLSIDGLDRPIGAAEVISIFSPIASGKINVEETRRLQGGETR
jgi:molybdopterin synthase sulfur carrier subunit